MADKNHATVHWSQLDEEAQVRFWQRVDTGEITSFLVSESGDPVHLPLKKPTKRGVIIPRSQSVKIHSGSGHLITARWVVSWVTPITGS